MDKTSIEQDFLLYPLYASAGLTFCCLVVTGARCTLYSKWLVRNRGPQQDCAPFSVLNVQELFRLWKAVRLSCFLHSLVFLFNEDDFPHGSSCHISLLAFALVTLVGGTFAFSLQNLLQRTVSVLTAESPQWMVSTGDAKVYDAKLPGGALWDPFGLSQVAGRNDSFPHGWMVGWLSFSFGINFTSTGCGARGIFIIYIYIYTY